MLREIFEELEWGIDSSFPVPGRWKLHTKSIPHEISSQRHWPEYYSVFLDGNWIGDVFREDYKISRSSVTGIGKYVALKDGSAQAAFGSAAPHWSAKLQPSAERLEGRVIGKFETSREALEALLKKNKRPQATLKDSSKMFGWEDHPNKIYRFLGLGDYHTKMHSPDHRDDWKVDPEADEWMQALQAYGFEETTTDVQRSRGTRRFELTDKLSKPKRGEYDWTLGDHKYHDTQTYYAVFHNINDNGIANYVRVFTTTDPRARVLGKNISVSDGVQKVLNNVMKKRRWS